MAVLKFYDQSKKTAYDCAEIALETEGTLLEDLDEEPKNWKTFKKGPNTREKVEEDDGKCKETEGEVMVEQNFSKFHDCLLLSGHVFCITD